MKHFSDGDVSKDSNRIMLIYFGIGGGSEGVLAAQLLMCTDVFICRFL